MTLQTDEPKKSIPKSTEQLIPEIPDSSDKEKVTPGSLFGSAFKQG